MGYLRSPSLEACDARWRVCVLGLSAEVNFQEAVGGFEAARPKARRLRHELPQEDVVFKEVTYTEYLLYARHFCIFAN